MVQEEETQNWSNNCTSVGNFGGRSSFKRQKHKKQPQRGLGVAQLEKIRLEEQKKRDGSKKFPSPLPTSPTTRPSDIRAQNCTLTEARAAEPACATTVALGNSEAWKLNHSHQVHGSRTVIWRGSDLGLDKKSCVVDPGPAFHPGFDFFYGSNPGVPLPGLMQRPQQYQQPSPPSHRQPIHLWNGSSGLLSQRNGSSSANSSSSLLNEPPSNQGSNANYSPFWPDEEKIVGMKRSYWFSSDNPQGTYLPYRLPAVLHPLSRSDEPPSFASQCSFEFRQGSSSSSNSVLDTDSRRSISQNGDFLKLAPPTTTDTSPISKIKGRYPRVAFNSYQTFDFDSLMSYQGSMEKETLLARTGLRDEEQPYYYSFLPPSMDQTKKSISSFNNGEVAENIDLNLKL